MREVQLCKSGRAEPLSEFHQDEQAKRRDLDRGSLENKRTKRSKWVTFKQ